VERFTTFSGSLFSSSQKKEGLHHLLFAKHEKASSFQHKKNNRPLKQIYSAFSPKEIMIIPICPMADRFSCDFHNLPPESTKNVEIYNAWGSSECLEKEGNPRPITSHSKKGMQEAPAGSVRRALDNNHRLGFVAGGYDDRPPFNQAVSEGQKQYSPGMTAIIANTHSQESLWKALRQRSCYATTGAKMLLHYTIGGLPMGSELSTDKRPGLLHARYISITALGTAPWKEVLIIRNGTPWKRVNPQVSDYADNILDESPFEEIAIQSEKGGAFTYYYIRFEQEDGELGWASPIWIDHP
ncbi:MAG: DUF3604 domain-containing protein, partial [Chlamydiota bacterium]|nr:DUF3604 domain-containing protein [Chlamydiota bacterium]